jgi:hypothetical protein
MISFVQQKPTLYTLHILVLDVTNVFWQKICHLQCCPLFKHAAVVTNSFFAAYQTPD